MEICSTDELKEEKTHRETHYNGAFFAFKTQVYERYYNLSLVIVFMFVLTALNISFYFIKIRNQIKIKIRKKIQKSKA